MFGYPKMTEVKFFFFIKVTFEFDCFIDYKIKQKYYSFVISIVPLYIKKYKGHRLTSPINVLLLLS